MTITWIKTAWSIEVANDHFFLQYHSIFQWYFKIKMGGGAFLFFIVKMVLLIWTTTNFIKYIFLHNKVPNKNHIMLLFLITRPNMLLHLSAILHCLFKEKNHNWMFMVDAPNHLNKLFKLPEYLIPFLVICWIYKFLLINKWKY